MAALEHQNSPGNAKGHCHTDVTEKFATQPTIDMVTTAKQYGGGSLTGTISTKIIEVSPNEAEVEVASTADLRGGLVRAGKAMIEATASEIIKMYITNVREALENPVELDTQTNSKKIQLEKDVAINVFAVLFQIWRSRLLSLFGWNR